jgi:hypothetical protein
MGETLNDAADSAVSVPLQVARIARRTMAIERVLAIVLGETEFIRERGA